MFLKQDCNKRRVVWNFSRLNGSYSICKVKLDAECPRILLYHFLPFLSYTWLKGFFYVFSALNPDKWLEFKLQDTASVSHNTQLFRSFSKLIHFQIYTSWIDLAHLLINILKPCQFIYVCEPICCLCFSITLCTF